MIYTIQENIDFYRAGYQIIGQNSFEDAVYKAVGKIVSDFSKHIDTNLISYDKFYKGTLLKFHTIMIAEGIKEYVLNDKEFDPLYLIELYRWLISSSEILLEEK
ncbi:TetR/AcrR family transcriptional regulator C-terminal domain-containing protein [Allocoprobacillus halotolerans]|uniref:TetR/AcrR family transcriptional regulator C-terminal domain-containing protein n=1 Tax=Allocoprobacillus halotolerans TaxID=2944914 RepID=A0ABY5I3Y2_9FIRM|nr:TetR/AcrR family transcriptional regulator C-terminal domain-containing protein [Allocoprobacillus halotolerans]UTY40058.1 TetR/AcrR family transcriptional regulator C-terminal domain-containing protein [Allocoprobacillus halotolerans]